MNEANGQLRAAHIILEYKPICLGFQAPKCVTKAKDPRLQCIRVAHEGFLIPKGILIFEGTTFTEPLFVGIPSVGASSSQPIAEEQEEEKEEKEKEIEEFINLSDSEEEFEVFRRPLSPEGSLADLEHHQQEGTNISDEMGIQRRP